MHHYMMCNLKRMWILLYLVVIDFVWLRSELKKLLLEMGQMPSAHRLDDDATGQPHSHCIFDFSGIFGQM